ncbi:hypothetical protein VM98_36180, partial [Streptomyces rubellomurinus subsp. indigoferus]
DEAGCGRLNELPLHEPPLFGPQAAVAVQVVVGGADDPERRFVDVYARPDGARAEQPWVRHASCTLAGSACATGAADGAANWAVGDWPPAGAERIGLDGHYPRLAETGYAYGPA